MSTKPSLPTPEELRELLQWKFSRPLSRTCGFPECDVRMTVELAGKGTGFRAKVYCSTDHKDLADRRRKKLKHAIEQIDKQLRAGASGAELPDKYRLTAAAQAELISWRRRIKWELDGLPQKRK